MEKLFLFLFTMFTLILISFVKSFLYIKITNFKGELHRAILTSRNFIFSIISLSILAIILIALNAVFLFYFKASPFLIENYLFFLFALSIYVFLNESWFGLVNWITETPFIFLGLLCLLSMFFIPEACFPYVLLANLIFGVINFIFRFGSCFYWCSDSGDHFSIFLCIYYFFASFSTGLMLLIPFLIQNI